MGEDKKEFAVHKELISHYSPFFKSACKDFWKESQTGVIKLPADRAEVFKVFANWLYSQVFTLQEDQTKDFKLIIDSYVFGDKVDTPAFQNDSIDAISRLCKSPPTGPGWWTSPSLSDIQYAYQNTIDGCSLQQFLVDVHLYGKSFNANPGFFLDKLEFYPPKFVVQLFQAYCKSYPKDIKTLTSPFKDKGYDAHPDGGECSDEAPKAKRMKVFV